MKLMHESAHEIVENDPTFRVPRSRGRDFQMLKCGIRVLRCTGAPLSLRRASIRYLVDSGHVFREAPIVDELSTNPAFEARPLKSASGWYVRVAWPNGKREHVPGFVTQQEAQRWIEGKAPTWLSERCSAPEAFGRLATAS